MKTVFCFIRHAQPNYKNRDDMIMELTEKGLADRLLVTDFLEKQNTEILLSSPYRRAVDTLKHYADKRGLIIRIIDDFRERKISERWLDDYVSFTRAQWANFDYKMPCGESLRETQTRNIKAIESALKEYSGKCIAVGSHATALSSVINYYDKFYGYDDYERIKEVMPWAVKLVFEDGACAEIEKINLFS